MKKLLAWLHVNKYEVLLAALIQHLFIGVFVSTEDTEFYTKILWPINILIVGVASVGIFVKTGRLKRAVRNILFLVVLGLPVALPIFGGLQYFMLSLNIAYVLFFSLIFREIIIFLIRPGYINKDLITASACGYFLLLEISVFLMQAFLYEDFSTITGIDDSSKAAVFMDLVYFNSITLTSIGFGDIAPKAHYLKLITAFIGIVGQFYSVVLVGILISKFSSKTTGESSKE